MHLELRRPSPPARMFQAQDSARRRRQAGQGQSMSAPEQRSTTAFALEAEIVIRSSADLRPVDGTSCLSPSFPSVAIRSCDCYLVVQSAFDRLSCLVS